MNALPRSRPSPIGKSSRPQSLHSDSGVPSRVFQPSSISASHGGMNAACPSSACIRRFSCIAWSSVAVVERHYTGEIQPALEQTLRDLCVSPKAARERFIISADKI